MLTWKFLPSWCVKSVTLGAAADWGLGVAGDAGLDAVVVVVVAALAALGDREWAGDVGGEKKAKSGERIMIVDFFDIRSRPWLWKITRYSEGVGFEVVQALLSLGRYIS